MYDPKQSHDRLYFVCSLSVLIPYFDVMGPISEEIQDNLDRISLLNMHWAIIERSRLTVPPN